MASETRNAVLLRDVQRLFDIGVVRDLSDRQLLERFLTADRGDAEAAFTVLVERHGPMVLHVFAGEAASTQIRTTPRTPSRPRFWCSCAGHGRSGTATPWPVGSLESPCGWPGGRVIHR